jgi:hypothetical protein
MTSLKKRILIASTAAALLAGASLSAFAMGGGDRCDGPGAGQSGPRAEKMHKMMGERMAKRQADLKEKLLPAATERQLLNTAGYCGLSRYLNDKKLLR